VLKARFLVFPVSDLDRSEPGVRAFELIDFVQEIAFVDMGI
jgi:hypothetical protein